jgi:hypothetical protein
MNTHKLASLLGMPIVIGLTLAPSRGAAQGTTADAPASAPVAQGETAPPSQDPAATPAPAPANQGPSAEAVAPMPGGDAPPAPAEEQEAFPASWFRIDSDLGALQLWAGATHMLSDSVGIATDMYVNSAYLGELDIGPAFVAGPFTITPMVGLQVDWAEHRAAAFVPQLYVTGGPDPIYTELWIQNYQYSVFDADGTSATGGGNSLYARFFLDYELGKYLAVGPEVELTLALNEKSENAAGDKITSLPIGVNVMLPNYGRGNTFFVFAGYETADTESDAHLAGRLTFVRNF